MLYWTVDFVSPSGVYAEALIKNVGMIEARNEDNDFLNIFHERDGLCDEDNGKLDDT